MYLSLPDTFYVPVYYSKKDLLNIKELLILEEYNLNSSYIDESINRKDLVVGVSLPNQREDIWVRFKKTMEDYAKDKDISLKIESNDFDFAKQTAQIENFISHGIDVLIFIPADAALGADLVEKAHKAGVKVIGYDSPIKNSDTDIYIAFHKIKVGEIQGSYLVEKVPRGNYIILSGDPDGAFKEGAMEYIQPLVVNGDIKIIADKKIKGWDPKIAYDVVKETLISSKNKIDAILAPNDNIAGAVIEALKEKGLAGKVVVTGQDADLAAIRRIIERTQSMTVLKDPRISVKVIIDAAVKLANNEKIITNIEVYNGKKNVPTIFLPPIAVDNGNLKSVIIDSGYLKPSEIYKLSL